MKEIIQHILEVEQQAKKIVEDSLEQVRAITENTRSEALSIVENARNEAQTRAADTLMDALAAVEEKKKKRLDEIRLNAPRAENLAPELRRAAVEKALALIIGLAQNGHESQS